MTNNTYLWAGLCFLIIRVTNNSSLGFLHTSLDKFIIDVLLDECSRASQAYLSRMVEDGIGAVLNSNVNCTKERSKIETYRYTAVSL